MGIDGHLERTSFFTGVEPAQKEWRHFDGKLRCYGKANVPKKKHLRSCSNTCSLCLQRGARFIFLWRDWLTRVIKKNKIWPPTSGFTTCRHETFTDFLRKSEIGFLWFCENKTNWLLTQRYGLALQGCNVWAESWSCKISATLFPH